MPVPEKRPKRILVAPLDWGLGHATRCIPLIRVLVQLGCEVLIGAEGSQAALLQEEFPRLPVLSLKGYHIQYSGAAAGFGMKMARQLPRIRRAVRREQQWLKEIIPAHAIDAVISDNRFGLHHREVPCIIMTHQLLVKSPFGKRSGQWLQRVNYHYIQKFNACWVVDAEGEENLAGELSHPEKTPRKIPVEYIGALSRFDLQQFPGEKYDLLVLISGPEPQRSLWEKKILKQIRLTGLKTLLVSGKPGSPSDETVADHVRIVHHLNSRALNEAILQSRMIICRSGYTSVMDLIKLRKKAILVPTPGQTEQEYLGDHLMKKGYFITVRQESFDLQKALESAGNFPFHWPEEIQMDDYKKTLRDFVGSI